MIIGHSTCDMFVSINTDIQCDNLSTPANGEITSCSSGRKGVGYEGDTCSFTCNTGYELTGSDTRTCQSNGSWSDSDDVCRRSMLSYVHTDNITVSTKYSNDVASYVYSSGLKSD